MQEIGAAVQAMSQPPPPPPTWLLSLGVLLRCDVKGEICTTSIARVPFLFCIGDHVHASYICTVQYTLCTGVQQIYKEDREIIEGNKMLSFQSVTIGVFHFFLKGIISQDFLRLGWSAKHLPLGCYFTLKVFFADIFEFAEIVKFEGDPAVSMMVAKSKNFL